MRPVPLHDLLRPPRHPKEVLIPAPQPTQVPEYISLRRSRVLTNLRRETSPSAQNANFLLKDDLQPEALHRRDGQHGSFVLLAREQLAVVEKEE